MQHIHPISHDTVYPLIGRKICAVTNDGRHYNGIVSDVRDGRVLLTECSISDSTLSLASVKNEGKSKKSHPKKKAKLSGLYGGYGYDYGYGSYWIPFVLIASLFLLPFFFF